MNLSICSILDYSLTLKYMCLSLTIMLSRLCCQCLLTKKVLLISQLYFVNRESIWWSTLSVITDLIQMGQCFLMVLLSMNSVSLVSGRMDLKNFVQKALLKFYTIFNEVIGDTFQGSGSIQVIIVDWARMLGMQRVPSLITNVSAFVLGLYLAKNYPFFKVLLALAWMLFKNLSRLSQFNLLNSAMLIFPLSDLKDEYLYYSSDSLGDSAINQLDALKVNLPLLTEFLYVKNFCLRASILSLYVMGMTQSSASGSSYMDGLCSLCFCSLQRSRKTFISSRLMVSCSPSASLFMKSFSKLTFKSMSFLLGLCLPSSLISLRTRSSILFSISWVMVLFSYFRF